MAPRPLFASLLLLLPALLLVSTGCRENAGAAFAKAQARYQGLLEGGKPAHDPGFTEVLEELAKVPRDSPFSARARRLEEAIAQARARRPPIPLATGGHGGADGGIEALQDACEDLARRMGESQYETERADLKQRVLACRDRVLKLREETHHEATPETEPPAQ
ncbi:MAG: hypothetical protein M3Y59_07800 [Myxococcota bacterium]|nr:hypothetical protein [Myxococcota bacterium]